MIYITAVHMEGGAQNEHIGAVKWQNPASGAADSSTRPQMVEWIRDQRGDARVNDGTRSVQVGVVEATPPYIRTHADGVWTDNLLALPRY